MKVALQIEDPTTLALWPLEPALPSTSFQPYGGGWVRLDLSGRDGAGRLPQLVHELYLGLLLRACEDPRPVLTVPRQEFPTYDDFVLGEALAMIRGLKLSAVAGDGQVHGGPLVQDAQLLPGVIAITWGPVVAAAIVREEFRWSLLPLTLPG